MKREERNITGIIETQQGNVVFSAENFKFTFMTTRISDESIVLRTDESGYIWGRTHDKKVIAIYSRNDIEVKNRQILNTWNFIISKYKNMPKQSMQSFKGIRFKNGAIKTINPCNGLVYDTKTSKGDMIVYRRKKDYKEYKLTHGDKLVDWTFFSIISHSMNLGEGDALSNSTSLLDVTFDKEQQLSVFYDYYGYVCDLCSFLVFRKNISFEMVYLFHENIIDSNGTSVHEPYAECYIKAPDEVSQRKLVNIIHLHYINDEVFKNIFYSIIDKDKEHKKKDKKLSLPLAIAPKNNSDIYVMDIGRIKNICSDLEMELNLAKVRLPINAELQLLTKWIKKMIKHHKKGNTPLNEKEYSYIYNNMSHWGQPLAEITWEGWRQHKDEMSPFLKKYGISITQENIQAFVTARNNATHNGFAEISDEVRNTAFVLMGLIYCFTLTRLGMQPDVIKKVMEKTLFS